MNYFSTDGIRGKYPNEVNEELFKAVGRSLGILGQNTVVIGYDNRESSLSLAKSLLLGLNKAKIEIINFGLASTPMLQFYSLKYKCLGAMITASHNNEDYNGVKLFINGEKISKNLEQRLNEQIAFVDDYYNFIIKYQIQTNKKIAIDCANGATSKIATKLFNQNNYYLINNDITQNINCNCGTEHINNLLDYVTSNNLDLGFALDGDGDRVKVATKNGNIITGDYLLYILALYYKKKNKLRNNGVVLTKMTNQSVIEALKKEKIEIYYSDVGDKYVLENIKQNNLALGAEASGHIILYDILPYGDGLLNILVIIHAINELQIDLDELYCSVKPYYSIILNYNVDCFYLDLSKFKEVYSFVRKSGTENVYRIFLQSRSEEELARCILFVEENYLLNHE